MDRALEVQGGAQAWVWWWWWCKRSERESVAPWLSVCVQGRILSLSHCHFPTPGYSLTRSLLFLVIFVLGYVTCKLLKKQVLGNKWRVNIFISFLLFPMLLLSSCLLTLKFRCEEDLTIRRVSVAFFSSLP